MKAVLLLCLVVLIGVIGGIAAAQSSTLIALDTPITGAVTPADNAPSFFFDAAADQPLTVVITPADGLIPLVLIAQAADNVVIGTVTGAAGLSRAFATVTPRTSGQHFVQVQGVDDTAGAFTLTISTSAAILTPTITPTVPPTSTAVPTPISEPINDAPRIYTTSSELPLVVHTLETLTEPQVVTVTADEQQPIRVVLTDAAARVIAALDAPLFGGSLFVPAGADGFTVRVEGVIAAPVTYSIRAQSLTDFAVTLPTTPDAPAPTPIVIATNTPSAVTPTVEPTPTPPLAASAPDLVINWNTTSLVITNISEQFLDIHALVLQGGSRRVDANIWDQTGTVDIFALPPGSCVGLRTLAFPDAPALPPDCDDLAAWWASDALAVWLGESFTVQAGNVTLQTCTGAIGQCLVDLPGE